MSRHDFRSDATVRDVSAAFSRTLCVRVHRAYVYICFRRWNRDACVRIRQHSCPYKRGFCNYRIEIFIGRKPSELFEATNTSSAFSVAHRDDCLKRGVHARPPSSHCSFLAEQSTKHKWRVLPAGRIAGRRRSMRSVCERASITHGVALSSTILRSELRSSIDVSVESERSERLHSRSASAIAGCSRSIPAATAAENMAAEADRASRDSDERMPGRAVAAYQAGFSQNCSGSRVRPALIFGVLRHS